MVSSEEDASKRDDELARTATAPLSSGSAPATPAHPVGATLGRYKLERELGSGGMGVVHAAFDPDLERRVALKVLRNTEGTSEARQRLLREARAMARLQHPNVVTVHEVASANGRDYVAMELIEGQTLAEWMREKPRPESEIIDAFVAAGRGLAAAHAEGIVHRDFKPHNILRHRTGRIAVTDFGLAREAEVNIDPMAATREIVQPVAGTPVSTSTPSSPLGGLTITGSVLGTPAYMAPEQWSGGAVTPATDQFAFCVALWEALAGERPFKGPTVETLREQVQRGPAQLDITKIPRRLRAPLLRGLDPDPARRWPSMNALLAAMTQTQRSSKFIWIIALAALFAVLAVGIALVMSNDSAAPAAAPPACRAAILAADAVWSADALAKLTAAKQRPAAELIDSDVRAWRAAREEACKLEPAVREPHLQCLDGVLARIDAVVRGLEPIGGKGHIDVGQWLVDPKVCASATPPRLSTSTTPQLRATIAGLFVEEATPGKPSAERAKQLIEAAKGDPCASVYGRYLAITTSTPTDRERLVAEATEEAERCSDDRVRAEIALMSAQLALESGMLGTAITSKVKLAEVAAQKVMQSDVQAALDSLGAEVARRANQIDEAIKRSESATKRYAERGRVAAELAMGLRVVSLRQTRAQLEDLASVTPTLEALRTRAIEKLGADHETLRDIEETAAMWQYSNGDVAGATKRIEELYKPRPNENARRVAGKVVDARGAPVASARVIAGKRLTGNALTAAILHEDSIRVATTGADGTFEIPDAVEYGVVVAQQGELRSLPALLGESVTLELEPTTTIKGRVDLRGEPYQSVIVIALDPDSADVRYGWAAPPAKDGSFEMGGVPRKRLKVFTALERTTSLTGESVEIDTRSPAAQQIAVTVPSSKRVVHVIVRSTVNIAVGNAAVLVMPGKIPPMSVRQMRQKLTAINEQLARQIEGERAPGPVVKEARSGDMFATMSEVPEGAATACAIALPADLSDPTLGKKIDGNLDKLKFACAPIPEKAELVVVEVPPFPRLD